MNVSVCECVCVCVCHCIGISVSATDKSPPHAARQHRDMGSVSGVGGWLGGVGIEIREGCSGKERCGKRNERD